MKITFPDGTVVEGTKKELEGLLKGKILDPPQVVPAIPPIPMVLPVQVEPMPAMPPIMPNPYPDTEFPRDWSGAPIVTCEAGGGNE